MKIPWLALIESTMTGTGRLFAREALQQGFQPILLAADPARYKYIEEDGLDFLQVNTQDEQTLLETCRKLAVEQSLAGITSSSEYYYATAATLAQQLGLPSPKPRAIQNCRDKWNQRLRLQTAGIGVPAFHLANSVKEAVSAAQSLGFPVVVKPVNSTGSIGVKLCKDANEVTAHAEALLRKRKNDRGLPIPPRILIESLAVGPEYSVEVFGKTVIGITEKHLGPLPHFVEVGHDYPAQLSAVDKEKINQVVLKALNTMDLGWGAAHVELRLTPDGPKIIEINPRLAGDYIPELVRRASGIDLISETISLTVTGHEPQLKKTDNQYASIRFILAPMEGTLTEVDGLDLATQVSEIVEVQFYRRLSEHVHLNGDFRDRVGHVIAVSDNPRAARTAAKLACSKVQLLMKSIEQ